MAMAITTNRRKWKTIQAVCISDY